MFIKKLDKKGSLIKPPTSQKIKSGLVVLHKGEEIGSHITENKEEIIIILQGEATVIVEQKKVKIKEKIFIYIPKNKEHNIINESNKTLKYIYIVTPLK